MTLLTDADIGRLIRSRHIIIRPFDPRRIMPSSYDLLVWHAAIVDGKMVQFDDFLDIKPREFALLSTKEHIELPLDIAGRLFLRSYLSRMGIFPESQGRVEAGYKGTVTLPIVNMNKNSVRISVDEPIVSIEFERLSKSVMRGYSGKYQGSEGPVQ